MALKSVTLTDEEADLVREVCQIAIESCLELMLRIHDTQPNGKSYFEECKEEGEQHGLETTEDDLLGIIERIMDGFGKAFDEPSLTVSLTPTQMKIFKQALTEHTPDIKPEIVSILERKIQVIEDINETLNLN